MEAHIYTSVKAWKRPREGQQLACGHEARQRQR